MEYGLTESEQRGYLTYMRPDYSHAVDVAGWYRVQGDTVVRRKIGGRNWAAFCSVESVYSFELYDTSAPAAYARLLRDLAAGKRANKFAGVCDDGGE